MQNTRKFLYDIHWEKRNLFKIFPVSSNEFFRCTHRIPTASATLGTRLEGGFRSGRSRHDVSSCIRKMHDTDKYNSILNGMERNSTEAKKGPGLESARSHQSAWYPGKYTISHDELSPPREPQRMVRGRPGRNNWSNVIESRLSQ